MVRGGTSELVEQPAPRLLPRTFSSGRRIAKARAATTWEGVAAAGGCDSVLGGPERERLVVRRGGADGGGLTALGVGMGG